MPADTGIGFTTQLTYGGYKFDTAAHITVEETPIYDDARRTVLYQRIKITATSVIAAPDSTTLSVGMQLIRQQLNEPGRPLTFKNAGFGDALYVNQLDGSGLR